MVIPLIIEWTYKDGSTEVEKIPAQIWRKDENKVVKVFLKKKEVKSIQLDPMRETADIDETNNFWPLRKIEPDSKFTKRPRLPVAQAPEVMRCKRKLKRTKTRLGVFVPAYWRDVLSLW